jgi:hypothetical protein
MEKLRPQFRKGNGVDVSRNSPAIRVRAQRSSKFCRIDPPLRLINDLDPLGLGADDIDLLGHGYSSAGGSYVAMFQNQPSNSNTTLP